MQSAAKQCWDTGLPVTGAVMVTITCFFDGAALDVDNMPKPILDALKGLVYSDDSQVSDLLCRKRDLNDDLLIQNPSPDLVEYLRDSKQVLHISVANALDREVIFW